MGHAFRLASCLNVTQDSEGDLWGLAVLVRRSEEWEGCQVPRGEREHGVGELLGVQGVRWSKGWVSC